MCEDSRVLTLMNSYSKPADQGGGTILESQGQANGCSSGLELAVISSDSCENHSMTGEENE